MKDTVIDFSNFQAKQLFINHVRSLDKAHSVSIVQIRKRRSDNQNAYYWSVVVELFGDWLRENGYDKTNEHAHEMLKERFLHEDVIVGHGGEIIMGHTKSTAKLTTVEFMGYIERCSAWMAEFCGVVVPPPTPWYVREEVTQTLEREPS